MTKPITRISWLVGITILLFASGNIHGQDTATLSIAEGKFQPTDESFQQYEYPDWFRDAKFGIWAHWGPQAVPRQGDWYARRMYESAGHPIARQASP